MLTGNVKQILGAAFERQYIDAVQLWKFIKKDEKDTAELLTTINTLVRENKMTGADAFEVVEWLATCDNNYNIYIPNTNPWNPGTGINYPYDGDRTTGGEGWKPYITWKANTTDTLSNRNNMQE